MVYHKLEKLRCHKHDAHAGSLTCWNTNVYVGDATDRWQQSFQQQFITVVADFNLLLIWATYIGQLGDNASNFLRVLFIIFVV